MKKNKGKPRFRPLTDPAPEGKHFFAYCVTRTGEVTVVRCQYQDDAEYEKDLMKHSANVSKVGYTTFPISEEIMLEECRRYWTIGTVRDFTGFKGFR